MCIGFPMQVIEGDEFTALCARRGERRRLSMMLVGAQPPGTFVLAHLDAAMRVIDEAEAQLIDAALDGLAAAVDGQDFEAQFADLIGREPELPAHLK
jgi:hydrogenase expression/formation protein HypC